MSRSKYWSGESAMPRRKDDPPFYPGNSFNPPRPLGLALARGLNRRCPACGVGQLYRRFLKIVPFCRHCGEALHHARPDDAPPYFVILIVGHIVVPFALILEETVALPLAITAIALALLSCALSVALLPSVKGAIVAIQWTFWMHGFDPHDPGEAASVGTPPPLLPLPQPSHSAISPSHQVTAHQLATADDWFVRQPISHNRTGQQNGNGLGRDG